MFLLYCSTISAVCTLCIECKFSICTEWMIYYISQDMSHILYPTMQCALCNFPFLVWRMQLQVISVTIFNILLLTHYFIELKSLKQFIIKTRNKNETFWKSILRVSFYFMLTLSLFETDLPPSHLDQLD